MLHIPYLIWSSQGERANKIRCVRAHTVSADVTLDLSLLRGFRPRRSLLLRWLLRGDLRGHAVPRSLQNTCQTKSIHANIVPHIPSPHVHRTACPRTSSGRASHEGRPGTQTRSAPGPPYTAGARGQGTQPGSHRSRPGTRVGPVAYHLARSHGDASRTGTRSRALSPSPSRAPSRGRSMSCPARGRSPWTSDVRAHRSHRVRGASASPALCRPVLCRDSPGRVRVRGHDHGLGPGRPSRVPYVSGSSSSHRLPTPHARAVRADAPVTCTCMSTGLAKTHCCTPSDV